MQELLMQKPEQTQYISLKPGKVIRAKEQVGVLEDGRQVVLEQDKLGYVVGIEIVN